MMSAKSTKRALHALRQPLDLPAADSGADDRRVRGKLARDAERRVMDRAQLLFAEPARRCRAIPRGDRSAASRPTMRASRADRAGDRLLLAVGRRMLVVGFVEHAEDAVHVRASRRNIRSSAASAFPRTGAGGGHAEQEGAGEAGIDEFAGEQPLGVGVAFGWRPRLLERE